MKSVVLIAMLSLAACGSEEQAGNELGGRGGMRGPQSIPSVEVVQAQRGALPLEERLIGIVKADNQVEIYPEITAPVIEVHAAVVRACY